MRRLLLALALVALYGVAYAAQSYRFERGVVAVGDTVAALVQRAGKPDRTVQLENRYGGSVGERWEYFLRDGKMVALYISGDTIYKIDDGTR